MRGQTECTSGQAGMAALQGEGSQRSSRQELPNPYRKQQTDLIVSRVEATELERLDAGCAKKSSGGSAGAKEMITLNQHWAAHWWKHLAKQ